MVKAVIFDWGQTLVDSADGFRAAEKQAQDRIYRDLNSTDRETFKQHYRRIRRECHARSRLSRITIWNEVYWYFCRDVDPGKLQQWESDYWHTVEDRTQVFPEALSVLRDLGRRYSLALITNTQAQQGGRGHRMQDYPDVAACFRVVIVAGEDDVPPKPDPRPFELCLDQLRLAPQEAVYVGDDWHNDICGARDQGIHPVWLKHHSVKRNYPEVTCDVPVITSLCELPDLIMSGPLTGQVG